MSLGVMFYSPIVHGVETKSNGQVIPDVNILSGQVFPHGSLMAFICDSHRVKSLPALCNPRFNHNKTFTIVTLRTSHPGSLDQAGTLPCFGRTYIDPSEKVFSQSKNLNFILDKN